jgi:hypothetical protein
MVTEQARSGNIAPRVIASIAFRLEMFCRALPLLWLLLRESAIPHQDGPLDLVAPHARSAVKAPALLGLKSRFAILFDDWFSHYVSSNYDDRKSQLPGIAGSTRTRGLLGSYKVAGPGVDAPDIRSDVSAGIG